MTDDLSKELSREINNRFESELNNELEDPILENSRLKLLLEKQKQKLQESMKRWHEDFESP